MTTIPPDADFRPTAIEQALLDLLLVPAPPRPPDGDPASIRIFRAGRNYYLWCLIVWAAVTLGGLFLVGALTTVLIRAMTQADGWADIALLLALIVAWALFISMATTSLLSRRVNYGLRWYIVTDRSLRIRSGIFLIDELTMTYGNIQEIRIRSGLLQNLLGLADVEVHAAGGGADAHGRGGHVGRFSGVANANEIRNLITERLRRYRDAGLGDSPHTTVAATPLATAVDAARTVLSEARSLRASLTPTPPHAS